MMKLPLSPFCACLASLLACGSPQSPKNDDSSVTTKTETVHKVTMHQGGTYTHKVGKRLLVGRQLGEWTEVVVCKVDCSGNDVLLIWDQTTVRFPGTWPAKGALVVSGTFDNPPLQLTFPAPAPVDGNAKSVRDVLWSADKLIIDGSPYDLVPGAAYAFTGDGLEALSIDATDE